MATDDVERMMERIGTVILIQVAKAAKETQQEETEAPKGDRDFRNRDAKLQEKSYKRMEKSSGGESEWQEWKYDLEVITRATNSEVSLALKDCLTMKELKTGRELHEEIENQPWRPTLRSG